MSTISQFKLTNVLGTMYSEGNLVFTPDSSTIIAPVGNKITLYDLKGQKSKCLCFESTHNYCLLAVSANGELLVALNEIGLAHFINLSTNCLIRSIRLGRLGCLKFSPNGKFIAVGADKKVLVYKVPSDESMSSEKPELVRVFKDIDGLVTCIDWSWDSKLLVVGSKDSPMVSVYSLGKFSNFKNSCFTGHTQGLLGAFFEDWEYNIYTICRGGFLCKWNCSTEPEFWEPENSQVRTPNVNEVDDGGPKVKRSKVDNKQPKELTKFLLNPKVNLLSHRHDDTKSHGRLSLTCAEISFNREFAVVGFDDGVFLLVGLPAGELIQQLRVTEHEVTTVTFAPKAEWLAIGAGKVGQLLVYDWQAEDYVLKEQGHLDTIQCLDFSTDGLWIATGAHDGKVKLWKTRNCFSFHTFTAHTSIVTGVTFMQNNRAVLSSSMDGTVRAFDVKRDRNFRTFTSPVPTQFSGVTIDSSSSYVAAGSVDTFSVYVWHLASARFLMEVTGHEAPISAISFSPEQGSSMVATVSWDKTLRIRDSIESESNTQTIQLEAEGTALAFRPDGKEIAVSTLNGSLTFFDPHDLKTVGSINCAHHMAARRLDGSGLRVNKNLEDLSFNAVAYSADGTWLLAGGKSVNLCTYNAAHQVIAHKFTVTKNRSLDGLANGWTQKRSNEFGLIDMLEQRGQGEDDLKLPGTKANSTNRSFKSIVNVYAAKFSPTGLMWAAATTEGVMLFSLDRDITFNPLGASTIITPQSIQAALANKEYDMALRMALRLNITAVTTMTFAAIPDSCQYSVAEAIGFQDAKGLLRHLASMLDETSSVECHIDSIIAIFHLYTEKLMDDLEFVRPIINAVKKAINARIKDYSEIFEQNKHLLDVAAVLQRYEEKLPSYEIMNVDFDLMNLKSESEHSLREEREQLALNWDSYEDEIEVGEVNGSVQEQLLQNWAQDDDSDSSD